MSALASEDTLRTGGALSPREIEQHWKDRIGAAKAARQPFIPIWLINLAFASGQHWVAWDKRQQRIRSLRELDPKYADRELFTADRITEYRLAALGELSSDDDRPQIVAVQEGENAEAAVEQLNRAVAYGWDHEWNAQSALEKARRYTLDLGTSAVRCRWDKTKGPVAGHAAYSQGQPVTHPAELANLAQYGTLSDGSLPELRQVNEGRTCWETYSSFGILAQPGVNHEDEFTWEILVRPVPLDELKATYQQAASLQPDPDVASAMGLSTSQLVPDIRSQGTGPNRLKGHVWVYTCFQRPNAQYPKGAVAVIASNEYKLLDFQDELPYQTPDGCYHSGVVYFHWDRKNDRFYSRAWIEPMKDPQRIINRRETQNTEIIDRAMPRTFVRQGDMVEAPTGVPMEVIELSRQAQGPPEFWQGSGPGAWMYEDLAHQIDNLGHASTMSAIRLGENLQGVDTYSTLAQLNDNETSKRAVIIQDQRSQIAKLTELSIFDMQRYWPANKQILIAGDEDQISRAVFDKRTIPTFYMAKVITGAPEPRSQGAELKKVDAVWAALVQSWVAVQNGAEYSQWYWDCIQAGELLELPEAKANTQHDLAYLENKTMSTGVTPPVSDYDNLQVHLPIHREAQDQARAQGDQAQLQAIMAHIQQHQAIAQANVQQAQAIAAGQDQAGAAPAGAPQMQAPMPREPYPNRIPPEFNQLAQGQ